jgi:DNA (cytosine-5)-methyltransferase 1
MKVLSLFSGVGGFDLGLEAAGMQTIYQCEWDKHATNILNRHWPDVPKWGDISTLTASEILRHGQAPDVVAWGSPCQDLSVAGKRAGLAGERSGLFHEGIRIIKELRKETNNAFPRFSIWENVAGALSSNGGADFGAVIDEMAEAGALVIEWAMLDAQHFGVPQRRRRVFVVAVFDPATAERCPEPLLPVSQSVSGNTKKGKQKGQNASGEVAACLRSGGAGGVPSGRGNGSDNLITGFGSANFGGWAETETAVTLSARDHKGGNTIAVEPILLDGTRVDDVRVYESPVQTLKQRMGTGGNNVPMLAIPIHDQATRYAGKRDNKRDGKGNGLGIGNEGDPMNTLTSADRHAIAFSHTQGLSAQPSETAFPTLRKEGGGSAVMEPAMTVRRLTPIECERLMGWPDNWTDGQADSHRYKQCGNGVASPVAQWIAQHLLNI